MLIILLSWIFITLLAYPTGVLLHSLLTRLFRLEATDVHFTIYCTSGLMVASFVSSLHCLILPVGLASNLFLAGVAASCFIFNRNDIRSAIKKDLLRLRQGHWVITLLFLFLLLIVSYLSYMPSSHYDDGLYYSTSIKWLQEYGTVKGLANVNTRIGFNSSWHILQANFGFRFLNAGLFNDLNGLLLVWMLLYSMGGINSLIRGDNSLYNCLRALIMMPVLFLHFSPTSEVMLFNVNFLSSPTADIPACLLTWLICMLLIKEPCTNKRQWELADVLVVLYGTWLLSIKLSAVPIILVSGYIVARWIIASNFRHCIVVAFVSLVFILPWLTRNVLISGYLVFPFSAIDIFDVPWKLPLSFVIDNERAVKVFAVGAGFDGPFDTSFRSWFPLWLSRTNLIQKFFLSLVVIATISYCTIVARHARMRDWPFFKRYEKDIVCLATCFAGILFWLYKAPDFRFGYGFIGFYCMYFIALAFRYFLKDNLHYLFVPIALYMAAAIAFHYRDRWMSARLIFGKPHEYRMPAAFKKMPLSGHVYMYIVPGEDAWNAPLPAASEKEFNLLHPALVGKTIKQGFIPGKNGN